MRRVCAGPRGRLGGLALVLLSGCWLPGPGRPAGGLAERLRPFAGPQGADAVTLEVAVVEGPVGDRYLTGGVWDAADEQAVAPERRAVLEDNGFRAGLVGGIPPTAFLDLLASPRANPDPRAGLLRAGNAKPIAIGDPRPRCQFELHAGGQTTPVTLESGQCVVQLTPTLTPDGAVKLAFLPVVQHGAKTLWALPGEGGQTVAGHRPAERYPALGWELTLAAGDFAVVGARFEKAGTLGHLCFIHTDGAKPVQRLLVLRASRSAAAEPAAGD